MPYLIVIAGPNGAGKTTTAPALLRDTLQVVGFVNADAIAQGLSAFQPERAAFQAGRVMLARLQQLASEQANFAFESTLASRSFAPWIARLKQRGYRFQLVYLWLSSPDIAVARVAERVRRGGHDVPETIIRRRYERGLYNFFHLYRAQADRWRFYDNTAPANLRLLAEGHGAIETRIYDSETWQHILRSVDHEEKS